jgi:hypothetical protein
MIARALHANNTLEVLGIPGDYIEMGVNRTLEQLSSRNHIGTIGAVTLILLVCWK